MLLGNGPYTGTQAGALGWCRLPSTSKSWVFIRTMKLINGKTIYYRALDPDESLLIKEPGRPINVVLYGEYSDISRRLAYDGRTKEQTADAFDYRETLKTVRNLRYTIKKVKYNYQMF